MNESLSVIFLGSSQLMYNCARKLRDFYNGEVQIKVIDTSDSATQKKRKLQEEFGDTKELREREDIFDYLEKINCTTYLFSINNPYIIPKRVCANTSLIMVNLHHALLPEHPGRNAEAWTIYSQDKAGGISWHFITPGVDSGDILLQRNCAVTEDMTSLKLLRTCENLALNSFECLLPVEKIKNLPVTKQENIYDSAKKALDIPNRGYLNLEWTVNKCLAFLNAMNYGIAEILGKPKISYNGTEYVIKSYKVYQNENFIDSKKISFCEETGCLEVYDNLKCLKMHIVKRIDLNG